MTAAEQTAITGRPILLYDGVCGFCNHIVQLLLRMDREATLRFAPQQSELAAELLAPFPASPAEPEGIILVVAALTPQAAIYRRFEAIRESLRHLRPPWSTLGALLCLIPPPLREWSYGIIARNRYRLFGRFDTCPIPTESERSRILGM